jgi:hypothetical protein
MLRDLIVSAIVTVIATAPMALSAWLERREHASARALES